MVYKDCNFPLKFGIAGNLRIHILPDKSKELEGKAWALFIMLNALVHYC